MELRFSYDEIGDLIEKKSGKRLPIVYSSTHSIRVAYDVNVLFHSTSVGLDLTIERIDGNDVYLSFGGGAGIEFMVRQALSMAKNKVGGNMLEIMEGNNLCLHLGRNAQAGSLLDHITLEDIRFDEQYAIIVFTPKNIDM